MARKPTRSRPLQNTSSNGENCCNTASPTTTTATTIETAYSCTSTTTSATTSSSKSTPVVNSKLLLFLLFTIFACCLTPSHGYNIDLPSYTRHMSYNGSMFGFSIAFHKAQNGNPSLIVGAPKYNTTYFQPGVMEGGAVLRCSMKDNDCGLVQFDSTGNHRNNLGDVIERKSFQWLGATVATSRENDLVVACAPRYVFHTMTPTKSLRYDPVGTCFTSRNLSQFNEVSPCRTNNWGYHRQGSCQAGFSAATSRKGDRLYIGAPGSWYWQGQIYSVSPDTSFPYKPPFYQPFGAGGQTYSHDVTRPENQVYSTAESSSLDDDSYLGYSMVTGDFDGVDGTDDVAIGMPRGVGLLGKVVVNRWDMSNSFNITGRQIGEYFGYSLAAGDIDGDGLDDLMIGAPMYTEPGNAEGIYDVGRVYIHLQTSRMDNLRWTNAQIREGFKTKGRFGLSIAYLGDINRDGYGDFAVGAPYDGPHGLGVVYIFHGSKNGALEKPSQIIKSEDIVETYPYPRTFGFALAGGVDMDGNSYPDIAVGAYDSAQVYIFKSRPVAGVVSSVSFLNPSKLIDIENKNCNLPRTGKAVPCTEIRTCWSYTGHQLPETLEFDVAWILDAKSKKQPRMFFLRNENNNTRYTTIKLYYGRDFCQNEKVYFDNIRDKLTPLEVETSYNLHSSYGSNQPTVYTRRRREILEPVIDQNREIIQRDALNIQKNCGPDNICIPDLRVQVKTYKEFLSGSGNTLPIEATITNFNEDAFEAKFFLTIPREIAFIKVTQLDGKNETNYPCEAPDDRNNFTLICDLGNPFPSKQMARFTVTLRPRENMTLSSYVFHGIVNSTNEEYAGTRIDNEFLIDVPIWADTTLSVSGVSIPDFQLYKASDYRTVANATKEEHLGPQVVHLYNVRNDGPSTIEEAVIKIVYPYETQADDLLMYVMNQPETYGNIVCEPHELVNVKNLEFDETLRRKSYLALKVPELMYGKGEGGSSSSSSSSTSTTSTGGGTIITTSSSSSSSSSSSGGGGIIEKPIGGTVVTGSRTIVTGKYKPTEEDAKRFEKEDEQDSTGDASLVHSDRAAQAAAAAAAAAANSGSWHMESSSSGRAPGSVVVHMRNRTIYTDPSGHEHTVESSTEFSTNVISGDPNLYRQQSHSANYQQASGNYGGNAGGYTGGNAGGYVGGSAGGYAAGSVGSGDHVEKQIFTTQQQTPNVQTNRVYHGRDFIQMPGDTNSVHQQHNYIVDPYRQNVAAPTNLHNIVKDAGRGGNTGSFHHGTIELAPVGHQNVDQELQRNRFSSGNVGVGGSMGGGAGSGSGGYSQSYSYSSTGRPQSNYQQHFSFHQSNNKPYYGMESKDDYDETNQYGASGQRQFINQRRFKRDESTTTTEQQPKEFNINDPCQKTKCKYIRCVAKNLKKEDEVWVAVRMRMVAATVEKLAGDLPLNMSTMAFSEVTRLPFIGRPKKAIRSQHEISYKAQPEPTPVPDVVPLWVVVLAACAGALILLLLALLLYKCGFFNRNRPNNHPERQPLRNGYHGDEHL